MKPAPWRTALESQLFATIDTLENAIRACPPRLWAEATTPIERRFWYLAYHTIFWLDRYFTLTPQEHMPPAPYTMSELDPNGAYPKMPYSPQQLLEYLDYDRAKCRALFAALDDAAILEPSRHRPELSVFEFTMYQLRHNQHHAAQLNLMLRQGGVEPPRWVARGQVTKQTA